MAKRRRHTPEQIVRKLREADRLLAEARDVADVARHLEVRRRPRRPIRRGAKKVSARISRGRPLGFELYSAAKISPPSSACASATSSTTGP